LVPVFFTFYIQGVLKLKKKNNSGAKRLTGQFYHYFIEVNSSAGARQGHPVGPSADCLPQSCCFCGLLRTSLNPPIRFPHTFVWRRARCVAADIRCLELRKHPPAAAKVNKGTPTYSRSPCGTLSSYTGLCSYIRHERVLSE